MNIDKRIQDALAKDTEVTREQILQDQGLFSLIGQTFKGSLSRWVIAVNIATLVASAFLLWSGYQFFTASSNDNLIFWGVCFVVSLQAQISLKQWLFQEMYRNNIMREIKRVELAVFELKQP